MKFTTVNLGQLLPRRHWLAIGLTGLFIATTLILLPVKEELERRTYQFEVPLPEAGPANTEPAEYQWQMQSVQPGDSMAAIFQRQGLSPAVLHALTKTPNGKELALLRPNDKIGFKLDATGNLDTFRLERSLFEAYQYTQIEQGYNSEKIVTEPDIVESFAQGTITSSLFEAGSASGLSDNLVMQLAGIFAWDVDFALDIREGDNFSFLYQEKYYKGKKIGDGDILAASFTNQGKSYYAIRYEDAKGYVQYYTPKGDSMRKAFLRTPVDFARISSRFTTARYHPVLHKIRAHKGVDYAASIGTPIKASGDGKVIFAGRKGGYGNVVILQHGTRYTTLYGHMNGFRRGIHVGSKVSQGQVIGYVGKTGLASGPHLHYEFRVDGVHRDPLKIALPNSQPIEAARKTEFMQYSEVILNRLESQRVGNTFAGQ
jgi:murein DD-endopeptidase MepM/ murein hydrolase activator NlpD